MNRFLLALLGTVVVLLSSCYYDNEEELYPNSSASCDTTAVTYAVTVEPLLNSNCYACHSTSVADGGVVLDSYANTMEYVNNGKLLGTINHDAGYSPMPKNQAKLSNCNILKIANWINSGAINN